MRDGRKLKALQIGGPLAGILPASLIDTPFDFDQLAAEGCMVGHGGIVAFDDRTDMRALARHLLHFGAQRELRQVLPVPDRATAGARDGRGRGPVDRGASWRSCWRRSRSRACARTAAACRRRSAA